MKRRAAGRPLRRGIRAVGGLGLCLLAASVQAAEFSPAVTYALPTDGAKALLAADFDTDGRPDIAVALEGDGGKLALLLGGAPDFVERRFSLDFKPVAGATADFDRDGVTDIALAKAGGEVMVLLGNGKGEFPRKKWTGLGKQTPRALGVADFDRDGVADLVVAGKDPALVWLRGKGDGGFERPVEAKDFDDDDEFEVAALLVADLNGDGKADLIIPQGVYLGRGDGDFRWGGSLWCGAPMALAGNGDGRHELYCARSREPDRIARWRSDGDGKFRYLQDVSLEAAAGGLLAGDFDQDGVGELAVSLPARKELQLFDAPEAVALELTGRFAVGGEPTLLAAADWNGDGASDLAAASAKNASLWLLPQSWSSGAQPGILRLGSAAEEIGEEAGSVTLTVTRSDGSDGEVSAQMATADGEALAGEDYQPLQQTLMFADGVKSRDFTIRIVDDAAPEGSETFRVEMVTVSGARKGEPQATQITIRDDDEGQAPSGGESPADPIPADGVPASEAQGDAGVESGGGCTMVTARAFDPLLPAMTFLAVALLLGRRLNRGGGETASRRGRDSQSR